MGDGVEVLLRLGLPFRFEPVAVQYKSLLATTFHPELTDDWRLHRHFIRMCSRYAGRECRFSDRA